jgi:hypothetical protein
MSSIKEVSSAFRWFKALQKQKTTPLKDFTGRYTNFTLNHVWEKYDCQTQLLQREALVPLMKWNPEILDADVERGDVTFFDIKKPSGRIA